MNLPIIPRDLEAAWNEADEAAFSNRAALLLPGHEPRKLGNSSPHLRRVDPKVLIPNCCGEKGCPTEL